MATFYKEDKSKTDIKKDLAIYKAAMNVYQDDKNNKSSFVVQLVLAASIAAKEDVISINNNKKFNDEKLKYINTSIAFNLNTLAIYGIVFLMFL